MIKKIINTFKTNTFKNNYDENEITKFYFQLLKMKKKRPHIKISNMLNKCYPNATKLITKIINNNKPTEYH
jgi:hypothetical protein